MIAGKKREFSDLSSSDPCDDANKHGIVLPFVHSHLDLVYFCSLPLNFSSVLASSVAPALCFPFLSVIRRRSRAVGPSLIGS